MDATYCSVMKKLRSHSCIGIRTKVDSFPQYKNQLDLRAYSLLPQHQSTVFRSKIKPESERTKNILFKFVTLHEKGSFSLNISSVNVTKSGVFSKFGHIY